MRNRASVNSPSSESAFLPQSRTPIGIGPPGITPRAGRISAPISHADRNGPARNHPPDGSHERLRSCLTLGAIAVNPITSKAFVNINNTV